MNKKLLYPLFATPVYVNNVGDFPRPNLAALEYSSSNAAAGAYNFLSSTDKNVLHRPEFSEVHRIVLREVDQYAREIFAISRNIEFYVTNSWINVHHRGHAAGAHIHNNSLISGVLYLKVAENTGDIVFHRDALSLIPFPPALDLNVDSYNIYNCKSWGHRPKTNDICLFPSVLSHSVEPNASDEERWCLAFNVFARGNISGLHQLTLR
jgi:uncharacterized protein (TIGR02466 family)